MATVSEGDTLRAEATGRTYNVLRVEDGYVHVSGLLPLPKDDIERDIENGKITILG